MADTDDNELKARFAALSQSQQAAILDKHRQIDVDHDWWDSAYECFIDDMKQVGIEVHPGSVHFTGFWSQGDGASFAGSVSDWPLFLAKHALLPEHQVFLDLQPRADLAFSVSTRSYYSHSGTMSGNLDWSCDNWCEEGSLRHVMVQALIDQADKAMQTLEEDCTKAFRDRADELYKNLEQEYEHLTSDETVLESLISNELLEEEIDVCDTAE